MWTGWNPARNQCFAQAQFDMIILRMTDTAVITSGIRVQAGGIKIKSSILHCNVTANLLGAKERSADA